MANRREGGIIIVGVDNNGNAPGLTQGHVASWQNPDHTRQAIAPFADPFVYVNVEVRTIATAGPLQGQIFAIILVKEFEELPVLCAKPANDVGGQPNYLTRLHRHHRRERELLGTEMRL